MSKAFSFRYIWLFLALFSALNHAEGQRTVIRGKVTSAENGEPIPFANVYFKGTSVGATTNFEGLYEITATTKGDSLVASYIGYVSRTRPVSEESEQEINFQLEEDVINLKEVVFHSGENPAWEIMRNAIRNKKVHDKRKLDAYEYESYTKIQVSVDNISERMAKGSLMQKISNVLDSIQVIAGEDGKPVLPIFISEAISRYYFRSNPQLRHEDVIKTRLSGIGITDGTLTSQVVGASFQEYNFYQNWLNILTKEFVSPLSDGWKLSYEYYLMDSLEVGGFECYRLDIYPKREQDLAFTGSIWITKDQYALKQVDLSITQKANLNFIEKLQIQQELEPTDAGPWLPVKTRVVVDVGEVTNNMAGFLASFYISNRDIRIDEPYRESFYMVPVSMDPEVRDSDDQYWNAKRHDPLTTTEDNVYKMIDSLKYIPEVKTTTDLVKFAANGYHKAGVVELGPWTALYANNEVEGLRLGAGARTSIDFSRKFILSAMLGYGFGDEEWKYDASLGFILDRRPWTKIEFRHRKEVDPVWVLNRDLSPQSLFYAYSRFGVMADPFMHYKTEFNMERQIAPGLTQTLSFRHQYFNPLYDFEFYTEPGDLNAGLQADFRTSELTFETRFGRDELWVINDNWRQSLGPVRWPVIVLRYTLGLKDVFRSDFQYHKLELELTKKQKMGLLGTGNIRITGGYIFSPLPYPLLENHIGNESPFYIGFANNLMRYFEFSSDQWVGLNYRHQFQGFILNRIPLMKKLKWRLTGTANIIAGGMRPENAERVPPVNGSQPRFYTLNGRPYVELGYGIENILKIFRIDAFHRLTWLDNPGVRRFGIKVSFQLIL